MTPVPKVVLKKPLYKLGNSPTTPQMLMSINLLNFKGLLYNRPLKTPQVSSSDPSLYQTILRSRFLYLTK